MNLNQTKKLYDSYVMNTYMRVDLCLVKGKDTIVEDSQGKKYLDFFPGWAVSGLGHRNDYVLKSVKAQLNKIFHVSNNYYNEPQAELAKVIINNSFPGKAFFANSGAEANEAAIKLARKFGNPGRYEIITMEKSFHGRTLATLTATGQDKVKKGFDPLPTGFKYVPFNDIEAVKEAVTDKTIAIMLEPIQGEGGINIADKEYLAALRKICDEKNMLLIFDEVQTGIGRTGTIFAFQYYGVTPDIMTLAKSLGGGFPIGVMVASKKYADILTPGTHASTFGGSPIISAAALGVFQALTKGKLLKNGIKMGKYFKAKLECLKKEIPLIKKLKIAGLMIGVELDMEDATVVYTRCLQKGLLINCTQKNILRIMPPLCVTKAEVDKAMKILKEALMETK